MTALAGLWDRTGAPAAPRCARMLAAQATYAPPPDLHRSLGEVALGRRLFALTDHDAQDRGPVLGGDGALLLVADARIDNRAELGRELGLGGAALAELADPALLMHAVERWGVGAVPRLLGPFALIWWDARAGALHLARDAMGERPLHYHHADRFTAVASMPRGLHALPDMPYAADLASVADLLALVPETGDESLFRGLKRVPPGATVTITVSGVRCERFWRPRPDRLRLARPADYAEAMREQLDRAVARRLRVAEGAIGAHLSGGLDSGAVAATAARQLAPDRLLAFTAVPSADLPTPPGSFGDEGPHAAAVAAMHPNMEHIRVRAGEVSPLDLLDRHFHLFERPVLNPTNAVWAEAINDAARARGVRVLLTGQMGNFTLSAGGHEQLARLLRGGRLVALARLWRAMAREGIRHRGIAAAAVGPFLPRGMWAVVARSTARATPLASFSALRSSAFAAHSVEARARDRGVDLDHRPWADGAARRLWGLGRVDLGVYNKGVLGGWGIDLRDPTADRDLVEFALAVPDAEFIRGGVPRSLARRAFADRLPATVLNERRRGFQASDWGLRMRADLPALAAELDSLERCADAAGLVDTGRLRAGLAAWPEDGWNSDAVIDRYALATMRGVATGHFLRRVARSN